MRRVNEIFCSLQGEGCNTGTVAIFIRFSGCNLRCGFCDTLHEEGEMMSDERILSEIKLHKASMIVLTGGEPSLQIDEEFVDKLKGATGLPVAIETNGTRPLPSNIDWITVSPKEGMTDFGDARVNDHFIANELKVVDIGQDLESYFRLVCVGPSTSMLLQPCYVPDPIEREKNTRRTIQRVMEDPRWRLSLQTHRLLNIP